MKVIANIHTPGSQKDVHSFLGHDGYYRRFIENFSKLPSLLFNLLMKDAQFVWTEECQATFAELKKRLSTTPILRGPNWALPFHISSDASNTSIGAVLGQHEGHNPYVIYYVSKNLAFAELKYTVT